MIDRKSNWEQCCKQSVKMANLVGMMACGTSETLRMWHHSFVTAPEGLHHPTAGIAHGIGYELKDMIRRYALANLQKLGEDLRVMIEHTPKYHAELAGWSTTGVAAKGDIDGSR
jgi:hypothetical protein